ncbi:MAG: TRAP transporter small permease [Lachnospiraceae bacterium]|nr:TRAP transporter small permease [Lachnospiraceae bacterium]
MKKAMEIFDKVEESLAGICMFAGLAICFIEVVTRYFFGFSSFWAMEYILYFVVWAMFLGASTAMKRKSHIRLELFIDKLPKKARKVVDTFDYFLVLIFSIFFIVSGIGVVVDSYTHGYVSTSLAKTPIWIPQLILPISGVLFTIRSIENIVTQFKRESPEDAEDKTTEIEEKKEEKA